LRRSSRLTHPLALGVVDVTVARAGVDLVEQPRLEEVFQWDSEQLRQSLADLVADGRDAAYDGVQMSPWNADLVRGLVDRPSLLGQSIPRRLEPATARCFGHECLR